MSTESGGAALEAGNQAFHDAYRGARDGVRDQVPILVVLPTELALHHQGQRQILPYSCASFAAAKSAAHISVALFALTSAQADPAQQRAGVARLALSVAAALDEQQELDPKPLQVEITALLKQCLGYAQSAREQSAEQKTLRAEFASEAGPRVLHITELATNEQIAGLHAATGAALGGLSAKERAELQVVVVGDHQARARSLGMQYFKRRLDERPGVDERVTYGENISEEQEAISLVATRRLDEQIAEAFFGDGTRLQRDVLGDAAQRCLDRMSFPCSVTA